MDDMFSEAEEFEVQMDAEADENEEGVLEEEEEWEVQRDPEANESEEGETIGRHASMTCQFITEHLHRRLRDAPARCSKNAVVYHLDGGEGAQRYFCQEQFRLAKKMGLHFEGASGRIPSSCELRRKHLEVVSDEDRSPWLPNGSSAVDYVIFPPEKSPNKGQAPGAHVHRRNSIISLSSSDEEHGWHPPMAPVGSLSSASSTSRPSLPPITTLSPSAHQASSSGDTEIFRLIQHTVWMPAEFVAFDSSRSGSEYEFQWIPGIIWPDGIAPDPLSFYRFVLSIFLLVLRRHGHFESGNREPRGLFHGQPLHTARKSIDWMRACSFDPTPALEAMLVEPLAALVEHPLLAQDINAVRKFFGPGSVFLQLLAIQHSLGEAWDLNGQTFADIQTGLLLPSPPSAVRGMDAMWASADPIIVAGENQLSTAQLATFEAIFKSAHTHYFTNCSIVFYEYNWHGAAQPMELPATSYSHSTPGTGHPPGRTLTYGRTVEEATI
ncbi:hypothetical protein B0H14DRAFT_3637438 [Mycena olivaceomarginata]|nr:hypothetical protein B0H14DRAFT_3637438 [Mycena olivaceomarginata]